jgi:glutamate 5-kinase
MIIANSDDIHILHRIMDGRDFGTLFVADKDDNFELVDFVAKLSEE